ncbi:MAG: SDR family NAD(P)-dependent oxidoreductase [Cyclobacteriaceae bacterium]|nr:SDR family NAD(P)-dependent oxidoreductase [Cyclobacteriaceae bacterium]
MKNSIVTGASGNLGKACVEKFASDGYAVTAIIPPGTTLGFTAKNTAVVEIDLQDEHTTTLALEKIISETDRIDAALLLVGGFAMGNMLETDGRALKKMISLNFDSTFFACRPIFKKMLTQPNGGRIIMIGARPALQPADGKNMIAYALSKSLIFKFAELLNAEGASKNVITSVIVPSTLDTPANRNAMPDANFKDWVTPEEIASAVADLCSDKIKSLRDPVLKFYGNA